MRRGSPRRRAPAWHARRPGRRTRPRSASSWRRCAARVARHPIPRREPCRLRRTRRWRRRSSAAANVATGWLSGSSAAIAGGTPKRGSEPSAPSASTSRVKSPRRRPRRASARASRRAALGRSLHRRERADQRRVGVGGAGERRQSLSDEDVEVAATGRGVGEPLRRPALTASTPGAGSSGATSARQERRRRVPTRIWCTHSGSSSCSESGRVAGDLADAARARSRAARSAASIPAGSVGAAARTGFRPAVGGHAGSARSPRSALPARPGSRAAGPRRAPRRSAKQRRSSRRRRARSRPRLTARRSSPSMSPSSPQSTARSAVVASASRSGIVRRTKSVVKRGPSEGAAPARRRARPPRACGRAPAHRAPGRPAATRTRRGRPVRPPTPAAAAP